MDFERVLSREAAALRDDVASSACAVEELEVRGALARFCVLCVPSRRAYPCARPTQALHERLERKTGPAAATRRKPTGEDACDAEPAGTKPRAARGSAPAAGASAAESSAQRHAEAQEAIRELTSDGSERLMGARAAEAVLRAARTESGSTASQLLGFVQRALERARALGSALEQRTRGVGELRSQWACLHARACRQAIGRRRTLAIYDQRCARHLVKENCYEHMRRLTAAIGAVQDCSRRAPSGLWVLDEARFPLRLSLLRARLARG